VHSSSPCKEYKNGFAEAGSFHFAEAGSFHFAEAGSFHFAEPV
jgi:hypothetical protein